MNLLDLPREIFVRILEDNSLTMDDYKTLRCTAKIFHTVFTPEIFRRLPLSKTWKDWNRFYEIASRPHLAECVQELIWYELIEDSRILCHSQGMEEGCWCEIQADDETSVTAHELAPLARDIFWLTPEMCDAAHSDKLAGFEEQFLCYIDKLTRLDSLVSVPMPPEYVMSSEPYEFTAQLFYRCLGLTGPGFSRHSVSAGFFRFLSPAMMRDGSPIRRLHFIDHRTRSAVYNFTAAHSTAFEKLTHVNLCLNLVPGFGDVVSCLKRARNLMWLRVCVEGDTKRRSVISTFFGEESTYQWPKLVGLELVIMETALGGRTTQEKDRQALIAFLKAHAPTLRHLAIHNCGLQLKIAREMTIIPELELRSFRVTESDYGTSEVEESELLALVNKSTTADMDIEELEESDMLSTTSSVSGNYVIENGRIALAPDIHRNAAVLISDMDYTPGSCVYAHDKSEAGAPRWRSCGHNPCTLNDDPDGEPTREWEFRHRSGAEAIGDEPLEFFSDWDSDSELGDQAVPLPPFSESNPFSGLR